jgi:hypothetical protein
MWMRELPASEHLQNLRLIGGEELAEGLRDHGVCNDRGSFV